MSKITTRIKKDGTIQFYNGRSRASESESKTYIKENTSLIDKKTLATPALRKYFGAVKGGQKRAANSLYDSEGKFISNAITEKTFKQLKEDKGIDVRKLIELSGVDSYRELEKINPAVAESVRRITNETGTPYWYNTHTYADKIESYTGKSIIVNGVEMDAKDAKKEIKSILSALKRKFDYADASIKFNYKGVNKLVINTPSVSDVKEMDKDTNPNEQMDGVEIYTSPIKKKK